MWGDCLSELKFRCVIDEVLCDIKPFKPYAIKCNDDVGLILIRFKESETDQIRKLFIENVREEYTSALDNIQLDGSDGYFYIMSRDSVEKKEKSSHALIKLYRYYWNLNYKKKELKGKRWIQKNLEKYDSGLICSLKGKFSACKYIDKENNMCFPFRLHESRKKNQPLFIIFHGAGALGNDNIKQHIENKRLYKKVLKLDCNILSPQAPVGSNRGREAIPNYIKSVKKLVDELTIDFDRQRIYIVGTSFGGFCVWHISYLFPEYFAAAVPVMGGLMYDNCNWESYDMERLAKTPLWVAHSSDDTNVPIDNDDHCVEELKKLGADIKYTRWEKYGHSMSNKFYKTENWAEWCLSKSLKQRITK